MRWLIAFLVGLLAGLHTATWGMYKDSPHEGFTLRRYARSILASSILAPTLVAVTSLDPLRIGDLVVLFGLTYVCERLVMEFWKTFVREEDQSKYFIPMQFHIFGKVVESRAKRWSIGLAAATFVIVALFLIGQLDQNRPDVPRWMLVVLVGGIGGWLSAFGGAWKDAPIEGFETFKFFRSPIVATTYALLLAQLVDNLVLIALAAEGFTVATLETYKTFFFPSKPRGKFAGKPVHHPHMLQRRQYFVPLYVFIWLCILGGFGAALVRYAGAEGVAGL